MTKRGRGRENPAHSGLRKIKDNDTWSRYYSFGQI